MERRRPGKESNEQIEVARFALAQSCVSGLNLSKLRLKKRVDDDDGPLFINLTCFC